jgi:uncharacterized protein (TIGR00369 family)
MELPEDRLDTAHERVDHPLLRLAPDAFSEHTERRSRLALGTPLLRFLEARLLGEGDEAGTISVVVNEKSLNAVGALHGGAIATLLDVGAYLAVVPHLAPAEEAITHAFAASYLAPAQPGESLRACGRLLRRTGRLAFVVAELRSESVLLAAANVTKSIRTSGA